MSIKKYFWSLNPQALKKLPDILKDPSHPQFLERAYTFLSRCDNPKEVFPVIKKGVFLDAWPRLRRYWLKTKQAEDFRTWWESVYESLAQKERPKKLKGKPPETLKKIGLIIKEARQKKGISQRDFALLAGMKQPDISAIEAGKTNLTLETATRICKILEIKNLPFA
jgi:DNA-binding XRE family transcriptional regulator